MSTIKSSSEDLTLDADGGSSEIKLKINNVEKASISSAGAFTSTTIDATALTGNLPAISGASLTGLPAAGDKRNFIIDGDFTQWPEGTSFVPIGNNGHSAALWRHNTGGTGAGTITRETDVPTAAESNHQSSYSLKYDVTTLDATPDTGGDHYLLRHYITGTNFKALHQQEVTFSFWHKHTKTGTYTVAFRNHVPNRSYVHEYTQSVSDTWERDTHTFTMDTSGTWLFTDTDKGMDIIFTISAESSFDAGTADTWLAGNLFSTSNQVNAMDSTSNNMLFSQVGLYLGSTAPNFTSPPISTVQDQVDWYVQRYDYDTVGAETIAIGHCFSTGQNYCHFNYRKKMRIAPSGSSTASATFETTIASGAGGSLSAGPTFSGVGKNACRFYMQKTTSNLVAGDASMFHRDGSDTCWLMLDARH